MNIIVQPYGSNWCYCRPDTTWERENKDFYVPDGIEEVLWAPVIFARVSKAGKCIGKKFISRYYDSFNFGILLYCRPENMEGKDLTAFTSCADHTSLLPSPLCEAAAIEAEGNIFRVKRKGEEIFLIDAAAVKERLENAICAASRTTSLRIGDYVALELRQTESLASKSETETAVTAELSGKTLYEIKVIF